MREYLLRTKMVGNEVVVILPKDLLQSEQIVAGTLVKVTVQKSQKPAVKDEKESSLGPEDPWRLLE